MSWLGEAQQSLLSLYNMYDLVLVCKGRVRSQIVNCFHIISSASSDEQVNAHDDLLGLSVTVRAHNFVFGPQVGETDLLLASSRE